MLRGRGGGGAVDKCYNLLHREEGELNFSYVMQTNLYFFSYKKWVINDDCPAWLNYIRGYAGLKKDFATFYVLRSRIIRHC